jgi:hypothetical protein
MTSGFCPNCGAPRTGERFCGSCGNDFWRVSGVPAPTPAGQPVAAPLQPAKAKRGLGTGGKVLLGLIVIVAIAGIVELLKNGSLATGPSPASGAVLPDVPPVGQVWFGSSFDPDTFAIRGRTTTVAASAPFSMVGHCVALISPDASTFPPMSVNSYFQTPG